MFGFNASILVLLNMGILTEGVRMFEESPACVISVFTSVPALSVLGTCIGYTFVIIGAKYLTKTNTFIVPSVEGCSLLQQEEHCHHGGRRVRRLSLRHSRKQR